MHQPEHRGGCVVSDLLDVIGSLGHVTQVSVTPELV